MKNGVFIFITFLPEMGQAFFLHLFSFFDLKGYCQKLHPGTLTKDFFYLLSFKKGTLFSFFHSVSYCLTSN